MKAQIKMDNLGPVGVKVEDVNASDIGHVEEIEIDEVETECWRQCLRRLAAAQSTWTV